MITPRATMRLQFRRGFTFADAASVVPYLASLGISHVYASPIMRARTNSMHGYDVVDPTHINPELGGEPDFRRFVEELRRNELGLIVDVVPNHMAIGSQNAWWMDVLARGRSSRYAKYFDIDWHPADHRLTGKVLLPILGRPYGEVLASGELTLARAKDPSALVVCYFEHTLPVATDNSLCDDVLSSFNANSPEGREQLHNLLEQQHYRLAWWRTANDEINWRRFFDINELVAIRIEDEEVFEAFHGTLLRLYAEGLIDGVRVDHIDGLSQPEKYCRKLRERLRALEPQRPDSAPRGPAYFVVEKILAREESLPTKWQTDGTTGYDFMNDVSALLHDERGEQPLRELWQQLSGRSGDFDTEEEIARRLVLEQSFSAQRDALVGSAYALAQSRLNTRDYSWAAMQRCLTEILVHFPTYRIYSRVLHASPSDREFLSQAISRAKNTCLVGDRWLVKKLSEWLSGKRIHPSVDELQDAFLARFQQLSAPLCAKAVEDTAFYRYGRLLSRNDVGFDTRQFSCSAEEFHRKMLLRACNFPRGMLATATHDHKRGEDVRARLAVLSEIPDEWAVAVRGWIQVSERHLTRSGDIRALRYGELSILFQTIVGAWPHGLTLSDQKRLSEYAKRIAAWQRKALREAKLNSDWSAPNEAHERANSSYIAWLFSGRSNVLAEIAAFAQRIAAAGAAKGLAQALAKITAPGVPDLYQGTEYWDLSLVDPDNRTPVDFAARQSSLDAALLAQLLANWQDGRIKQFLIQRVLAVRKQMPQLFSQGAYSPLETSGPLEGHLVAFARVLPDCAAIAAFCRITPPEQNGLIAYSLPVLRCKQTQLSIPPVIHGAFSDVFARDRVVSIGPRMKAEQIMGGLPVAFLIKTLH